MTASDRGQSVALDGAPGSIGRIGEVDHSGGIDPLGALPPAIISLVVDDGPDFHRDFMLTAGDEPKNREESGAEIAEGDMCAVLVYGEVEVVVIVRVVGGRNERRVEVLGDFYEGHRVWSPSIVEVGAAAMPHTVAGVSRYQRTGTRSAGSGCRCLFGGAMPS
ncbi:hypothetical protein ACFTZB_07745 [Rhodococcus sp. NPDC057014]|uniref:hypothetical protein n=1 Tax=Rhodococcus sp. NPDC057014 TaxID=3346000 RepID=UPI00363C4654